MPGKKKAAAAGASQGGGAGSVGTSPRAGMAAAARPHLPGQDDFRSILPEDIDWKSFPAFPPSALLAVVVGDPAEPGPYTVRVKVPHGVKLMPHRHDEDRVYTVISGVFYIGRGDEFDADKLEAHPPGSVIVCPVIHPIFTGRNQVSTSRR